MTSNDQPMDHAPPDSPADEERPRSDMEKNVFSRATWLRLLFMIVLGFLYGLSRVVLGAVVVIQFVYVLLTGATNDDLKVFGRSLAVYSFQIVDYLTFNTEKKPFPLDSAWPKSLSDAQ